MSRVVRALALLAVLPFGFGFLAGAPADDEPEPVFTFADDRIHESSGLVARDGLFVTTNDSGDSLRIFTVDPADGRTVGTTSWAGEATDVEGLAPAADGEIWVGDIGDNLTRRTTVQVHRVPSGRGDRTVEAASYELDYPDGPHDAETLLSHPVTGRVYVVSKETVAGRVYETPATLSTDEPNRMSSLGEVIPLATDGAFFPDGRHLLVRDYSKAVVYTFPGLEEVARVDLPFQQQGEGVAIDPKGRVYVSSEGLRSDVLEIRLPKKLRATVLGIAPEPEEPPAPVEEEEKPVWPYFFMGGMALVVLYGAFRLVRGGSDG